MSFLKIGGKAIFRKNSSDTLETLTAGLMNLDGTVTTSTSYSYSQKITVKPDDVIWLKNQNNGSRANYRKIVAFNGTTAKSDLGYDPGANSNVPYIVPEGVDGVVLSGGNTAYTIVRETGDAYAKTLMLNEDGAVLESHVWDGNITQIANEQIRNTSMLYKPQQPLDVSGYAINSLRFDNTLDQPVNVKLYQDDNASSPQLLNDLNGNNIGFTVPANKKGVIVTAEDLPVLNYLTKIMLWMKCDTAPTEGALVVKVVGRR